MDEKAYENSTVPIKQILDLLEQAIDLDTPLIKKELDRLANMFIDNIRQSNPYEVQRFGNLIVRHWEQVARRGENH